MAMKITTADSFPPFVKILRTTKGGTGKELAAAMKRVWSPTWYQLYPYANAFGFCLWTWKDNGATRYRFVTTEQYIEIAAKSDRPIDAIDYKDLRSAVRARRDQINGTKNGTENVSAKPSRKGRGKGTGTGTGTGTETANA